MDKQFYMQMESLRDRMIEKALDKQTFLNREVLLLSQSLDLYIVRAQEEQRLSRQAEDDSDEEEQHESGRSHS
ncbi:aspartyl-phosphate phosphatase Spo0E family protein [Paenibacillus sp. GCM10023252]|uniref:aspartyl-phosphate phosphatase Spo0E family protein n=1 Tax=Paenibacillus sp. GCM10023252 TaxID=3252649 RepID=UPI003617945E